MFESSYNLGRRECYFFVQCMYSTKNQNRTSVILHYIYDNMCRESYQPTKFALPMILCGVEHKIQLVVATSTTE